MATPNGKAAPKPLSAARVKAIEAGGGKVWRTKDGAAFETRVERRAFRNAQMERS